MSDITAGPLDPRERHSDELEAVQTAMDGRQTQIHTMMPAQIVSYDAATATAVVQPAIQAIQLKTDGTRAPVTIQPIPDVPVHFPGGGAHILTFPVKPGDDCLLVFAERNIDAWYQHGGVQQPLDWRMHDITDAICMVGVRSQPKVPAAIDPDTVQLRSDDKKTVVQVDGPNQAITLYANGSGEAVVFVDGKNQAVTLQAKDIIINGSNSVTITSPAITMDGSNQTVSMQAKDVSINGTNSVVIASPAVDING